MADAYHMTLKIILLGDYSVNKGTLLKALTSEPQQPGVTCLGFCSGVVELLFLRDGKRIRVKINDTAGQERFRSITSSYYRGAHGCMLMFDVTQKSTFEGLLEWHRELHTNSLTDDIAVTLVGCNCHVTTSERQVAPQTAQELADYLEVPYEELTAVNVHTVVSVLEPLIDRIVSNRMSHRASVVSLSMDSLSHSMMAEQRKRQETHRRICRC